MMLSAVAFPVLAAEGDGGFEAWKARLTSRDVKVHDAAVREWLNGTARDAKAETIVPLFIPFIENYAEKREDEASRGLMMEYMGRKYGREAKAALPALIALATDGDANPYLRGRAIETIGRVAGPEPEVIAALIRVLENPKPQSRSGVHEVAARVLGEMGKAAEPARAALSALLMHEWAIYQDAAYIALGRIAEAEMARPLEEQIARLERVTEWTAAESSAAFLAVQAAETKKDPQAKDARAALAEIIATQGGTKYQRAAIATLLVTGPGGEPAMVRALVKAVVTDRATFADRVLIQVETTHPDSVVPLVEAMRDQWNSPNWVIPYYLAHALQHFGAQARPATPWLIQALQGIERVTAPGDAYAPQARSYILALKNIGAEEPSILPALVAMLDPESGFMKKSGVLADPVRCELYGAISALGVPKDGPLRAAILARVMEGLQSTEALIVVRSSELAGRSAAKEVVPRLLVLSDPDTNGVEEKNDLRSPNLVVACAAVKALGELGPLAKEALPRMREIAARPLPELSFDAKINQTREWIELARLAEIQIK